MRKSKSRSWNFRLQATYSKLPLSQKIIIPFLSIILSMGMITMVSVWYWFAHDLEDQMYSEVEGFSSLVLRDFNREEQRLRWQTQLVANSPEVIQAAEQVNYSDLLKTLVPIKTTLELDLIKVLDKKGQILTNLHQNSLADSILKDQAAISQALNGGYLSTLIDVQPIKTKYAQSLLVAVSPIKSKQGIIGAILIGTLIKDDLLYKITGGTRQMLVATNQNQEIIATTLPEVRLDTENWLSSSAGVKLVKIAEQEYLAKSAILPGLTNTSLNLISLNPVAPLQQAKHLLWLRLWSFFLAGGAMATIVGVQIARAIASPIQAVTIVARQATKEANFTLQAPVITKDEVGILAQSLNSLIRMVAEYTQKLELARQNLEKRVEERTQELVTKNQQLLNAHSQLTQTIHNLQEAQAQLIQTEKMSSLGQMVAGIAHEINNPVNFINGNIDYTQEYSQDLLELLELYQQEFPATPIIQERLEEIDFKFIANDLPKLLSSMKMGAHRISQIVLSLRNFSRLDHSEIKDVNIHEGIDSTLVILSHKLKQGVEIIKDYGILPSVECYPAQLNQVFMNIISNGIDALTENTQASAKQITIQTEIDQIKQQVIVRIRDNGPGIPTDIQAKIFDPFFTTKPIGKGTGLGLSISYQIIQKHQAHIEVNSEIGQGTEFVITLPVKQTTTISTPNAHKQMSPDMPLV